MVTDYDVEIDWDSYPQSDGEPMAESVENRDQMVGLIFALQTLLAHRAPVYVSGNEILYYTPGAGRDHISPDVFVAFGVPQERRGPWKAWETGKFPDVIFEISSPSTVQEDLGKKRSLYLRLGVREYYLFDPSQAMQPPFLALFRRGGSFVEQPLLDSGGVFSPLMETELRPMEGWLRVIDPLTGLPLRIAEEEQRDRLAAEEREAEARQQLVREAQARLQAEERAAAMEDALRQALAELARLQGERNEG